MTKIDKIIYIDGIAHIAAVYNENGYQENIGLIELTNRINEQLKSIPSPEPIDWEEEQKRFEEDTRPSGLGVAYGHDVFNWLKKNYPSFQSGKELTRDEIGRLFEYLDKEYSEGKIDFAIRYDGEHFYIHPYGKDGETVDFYKSHILNR